MAEQKSMVMSFTFDANSVYFDTVKTAIENVCEEGKIAGSLATKFAGLKFSILGNADKVISIKIAWDSGEPNEVGAAVFEAVGGLIGAAGGSTLGRVIGTIPQVSATGGTLWAPVLENRGTGVLF